MRRKNTFTVDKGLRRMQLRFFIVVTATLLLVFISSFTFLFLSFTNMRTKFYGTLFENISENDGGVENRFYQPKYFYVKLDNEGAIMYIWHSPWLEDFSEATAARYAESVNMKAGSEGTINNYRYHISEKPYGKLIIFILKHIEFIIRDSINVSLLSGSVACAVILVFVIFLSKWVFHNEKIAREKQRSFISDISHELKTPLTIISAGVSTLEGETPENDRIPVIKTQLERMRNLVQDMFMLALEDEKNGIDLKKLKGPAQRDSRLSKLGLKNFDLSSAVLIAAIEFDDIAHERGKIIKESIQDGIEYFGVEEDIRKLVRVLVDNAIKYSDENGLIEISLSVTGGSRPVISVYNTGCGIRDGERERVFDRFYRCDESRAGEHPGNGLGLSIAKAIADRYNAKIILDSAFGEWVRFTVKL